MKTVTEVYQVARFLIVRPAGFVVGLEERDKRTWRLSSNKQGSETYEFDPTHWRYDSAPDH